ncbi:hypothetical protein L345_11579, partial [Ophiophagus hannah]
MGCGRSRARVSGLGFKRPQGRVSGMFKWPREQTLDKPVTHAKRRPHIVSSNCHEELQENVFNHSGALGCFLPAAGLNSMLKNLVCSSHTLFDSEVKGIFSPPCSLLLSSFMKSLLGQAIKAHGPDPVKDRLTVPLQHAALLNSVFAGRGLQEAITDENGAHEDHEAVTVENGARKSIFTGRELRPTQALPDMSDVELATCPPQEPIIRTPSQPAEPFGLPEVGQNSLPVAEYFQRAWAMAEKALILDSTS